MATVSLNEPISCHCVREFKDYLMNVGPQQQQVH